jgi:diguanylate cyclase (GGDEF)-like protein
VLVRVNELLQSGSGEDADRSDVVMVINFDKLRELNESLGHLRGDEALARAAERLRECLPQPHLLGRVVGAEFCAVLQGADQDFIDDVSDAIHLALTEPIVIYDVEVRLRASIGLVRIKPDDERSAEEIVSAADTAMYYARNKGGGHTIDFNTLRINDE